MNQPVSSQGAALDRSNLPAGQRPAGSQAEPSTQRTPAIEKICKFAIDMGASDIHLSVGRRPLLRVSGALTEIETIAIDARAAQQLFESIADDNARLGINTEGQVDFAVSMTFGNESRSFRVNAVKSLLGISMTMRVISTRIPNPLEIGFTQQFLDTVKDGTGILLATGATGSGKSTTLASIVQWLAKETSLKIVTVEQPIEYRLEHGDSLIVQREVPSHAKTFADTLRSMLRQDPDVIMVGELRGLEEIRVALQAAESGHLVLSTVHTKSAAESVNRLIDVFPGDEQELVRVMLSQCLLGIVSQDLIPRPSGKGRVLAYELMLNNPAMGNLIRRGESQKIESQIQMSKQYGMHTFDSYLIDLHRKGIIDAANALSFARDKIRMRQAIASRSEASEAH